MPIYEYECLDCGHQFERRTKPYNPDPPTCPHTSPEGVTPSQEEPSTEETPPCGGEVRKLISRTSFVLKGGGWFKDGY